MCTEKTYKYRYSKNMMFILGGNFRFLYSLKFLTFSVCFYDFDILHARKMSEHEELGKLDICHFQLEVAFLVQL